MSGTGRVADTAALRARNAVRVLDEIRRRGATARVDIASALDLSPATVSAVVSTLLEQGLVMETRSIAAAGRGRPRVQLALNPKARHVAGAKLSTNVLTVAIVDFAGAIVAEAAAPLDGPTVGQAAMLEALDGAFDEALAHSGLVASEIAAFGFGMPGFVELDSGHCHWSPVLLGTPLDVRRLIEPRLDCPVFVDNDANLATLAELWFGHGRTERNFLVVTVEHGVGLGVVFDGRVYRGARGLGAEFGHTKVQMDGALCRCGQRGCLEAYVADFALAREAATALGDAGDAHDTQALLERLARSARAGDEMPAMIYRRAGRMLGLGLANLLTLFDPAMIVLTGESMRNHDLLAPEIERTMLANTIVSDRPPAPVVVHRWGDNLWARGAAALALEGLTASAFPGASTAAETGAARRLTA